MAFMNSTRQKMVMASGAISGLDTCMLSLTLVSTIVTTPSAYFWNPVGARSSERLLVRTAIAKLTRNNSPIRADQNRLSRLRVQKALSPNCQLQFVRWCWMYSVTVAGPCAASDPIVPVYLYIRLEPAASGTARTCRSQQRHPIRDKCRHVACKQRARCQTSPAQREHEQQHRNSDLYRLTAIKAACNRRCVAGRAAAESAGHLRQAPHRANSPTYRGGQSRRCAHQRRANHCDDSCDRHLAGHQQQGLAAGKCKTVVRQRNPYGQVLGARSPSRRRRIIGRTSARFNAFNALH